MPPKFYRQTTTTIAEQLLGQILVHKTTEGLVAGRIVETEAYLAQDDLASHSAKGQTRRNAIMFGPPGRAYIYFTYGLHWLFNVVTAPEGEGEAVLIRALEPLMGLELMRIRRHIASRRLLCNGPAKLVQAMGITPDQNGDDLSRGNLRIQSGVVVPDDQITTTTRIGIAQSAGLPLRFYIKDNPFISKP